MASNAARLLDLFREKGYTWSIGGEAKTPTVVDLQEAIDKAKELLYDEPIPSQLEVGHLLIRHWSTGKFDIYVQLGEEDD